MNTTTYKPVEGLPGYRIGDDGSVWSRWTMTGGNGPQRTMHVLGSRWTLLKGGKDKDGYRKVILCDGTGHRRYARVHILVLEAFAGPRPPGLLSAHRNGVRDDNRLDNLRWTTQADNCADKITCGTVQWGERNGNSKLTEAQVREIRRRRAAGESLSVLAVDYGVLKAAIWSIANRRTWKDIA
jgi:hypothetical protein